MFFLKLIWRCKLYRLVGNFLSRSLLLILLNLLISLTFLWWFCCLILLILTLLALLRSLWRCGLGLSGKAQLFLRCLPLFLFHQSFFRLLSFSRLIFNSWYYILADLARKIWSKINKFPFFIFLSKIEYLNNSLVIICRSLHKIVLKLWHYTRFIEHIIYTEKDRNRGLVALLK